MQEEEEGEGGWRFKQKAKWPPKIGHRARALAQEKQSIMHHVPRRAIARAGLLLALFTAALAATPPLPPAQRGLCVAVAIDGARHSVCAPDPDAIADAADAFVAEHRVANGGARADLALALSRAHRRTVRRSHAAARLKTRRVLLSLSST